MSPLASALPDWKHINEHNKAWQAADDPDAADKRADALSLAAYRELARAAAKLRRAQERAERRRDADAQQRKTGRSPQGVPNGDG